MKRWMSIGVGSIALLLVVSVLLNLSLVGYQPNIFDLNPVDKVKIGNLPKDKPDRVTDINNKFVGTKDQAFFMCIFRKDADYWKGEIGIIERPNQ